MAGAGVNVRSSRLEALTILVALCAFAIPLTPEEPGVLALWCADEALTDCLQVLRYSALGLGVVYGFYHQRTITSTQKADAAKREWAHKQSLIEKGRAEYAKKQAPTAAASTASGGRKSATLDILFDTVILPRPSFWMRHFLS
jgi:F-type H+-transporting ATP synthase subunit e